MLDCDLVIFDCDGVLIDSEVLSCSSLAETLTAHGLPMSLDEVVERFLGRGFAAVAAHYGERTGGPLPPTFTSELRTRLAQRLKAALLPMPHVTSVLTSMDRPYCLASSSDAERIRISLAVTRLDRFFGGRVFTAAMVARAKPAPDLFLLAAERMGAVPAATLVVEDSVNGILAAKAAGMRVWGFTGGSHYAGRDVSPALRAAGADRVFHSLSEFHSG